MSIHHKFHRSEVAAVIKHSNNIMNPPALQNIFISVAVFAQADGYLERHKERTQMVILGVI